MKHAHFLPDNTMIKDGMPLIRFVDGFFKTTRIANSTIFSTHNSKINTCGITYNERMVSFDLRAGLTCPAALLCLAHYDEKIGKLIDGAAAKFRCYAASQEAVYKNTRILRERNKQMSLQDDFVKIICDEIARLKITCIRVHSSGDFYSFGYAKKWIEIAKLNPQVRFFGYTKMASFIKVFDTIPNMFFNYSNGGIYDGKEILNGIPTNTVVKNDYQARKQNVKVTCKKNHKASDYEMILTRQSFAIIVHGTQAKKEKKVKVISEREKTIQYNMTHYNLSREEAIKHAKKWNLILS